MKQLSLAEKIGKTTSILSKRLVTSARETYLFQSCLPKNHTVIIPPKLYMSILKFRSVNLEAFCRLTISSRSGCFHVPVTGVDSAEGALGMLSGVEGRATADDIMD